MQIPIISSGGQNKRWISIPRLNLRHPLTKNLTTYLYDCGGGLVIDLVTGQKGSIISAGAFVAPQIRPAYLGGNNWIASATTGAANVCWGIATPNAALQDNLSNAAPYSFASGYVRAGATQISTVGTFFCYVDNTGSSNTPFIAGINTSNQPIFEFSNGTSRTIALTIPTGIYCLSAGVLTSATSGTCYYLTPGSLNTQTNVETTFAHTGFRPMIYNADTLTTSSQQNTGFNGTVFFGAAWKGRALTVAEIASLYTNPWSLLLWPEDDMFATLVGVTAAVTTSEDQWHQPWSSVGRRYAIIAAG